MSNKQQAAAVATGAAAVVVGGLLSLFTYLTKLEDGEYRLVDVDEFSISLRKGNQ